MNMVKTNKDNDRQFGNLLKKARQEAPENVWFTRKVMNRLPEKKSSTHRWVLWSFYCVALIVCVGFWSASIAEGNILADINTVITNHTVPQSIIECAAAMAVTGIVVWQMAATLLHDGH